MANITVSKTPSLGGDSVSSADVKSLLTDELLNPPIDEVTVRKLLRAVILLEYVRGNGALLEEFAKAQGSPITALAFSERKE